MKKIRFAIIGLTVLATLSAQALHADDTNAQTVDADAIQEQSRGKMEYALSMMQQASKGTEDLITLPIYEPSQIMIHLTDGAKFDGEKTLPTATFKTADAPDKIIAFYRQQLPGFKEVPLPPAFRATMLAEKIIPDARIMEYAKVPHITVSAKKDGSTVIEVGYQPK